MDLDGVTLMGFTVFKAIILWDYYLSRRGLKKFSNAFDVLERKHNLRLPSEEGPLLCYSEPRTLIVALGTKEGGDGGGKVTFFRGRLFAGVLHNCRKQEA